MEPISATALVAAAGDTEVAFAGGLFGGVSKATLAAIFTRKGLHASGLVPGITVAAAAAMAGTLTAKGWCDQAENAHTLRLAEVRSHARLTAAPGVALGPAMRQLLTSFNWCLSVEERRRGGLAGASGPNNLPGNFFGGGDGSDDGDISVGGSQRAVEKEMKRQVRRIWKLCDQAPPTRNLPQGRATEGMGQKLFSRRTSKTKETKEKERESQEWVAPNEAHEKLFNPTYMSASGDRGLCAALCYLVGAFIRHRKLAPGGYHDGSRASLRLAVAALARHPVFDEEIPDKKDAGDSSDTVEFRRGALALIPLMDAALAWKPIDPMGWFGHCEDDAPLLVAQTKGMCSFPALAARLKKTLNKAASGDPVTWRRLSVHLDSVRVRDLPHPWSWIWVQAQDASMLVRNHTKVPLRVELHRPAAAKMSPWADWPLLNAIYSVLNYNFWGAKRVKPLIVAHVAPGIEWAMRPKAKEGRNFELKLVTEHGVVVCSKRLRRGQTFDFKVNVPARKRVIARRAVESNSVAAESLKADSKDVDGDDRSSICSTVAPSSLGQSARLSFAGSSASGSTATTSTAPTFFGGTASSSASTAATSAAPIFEGTDKALSQPSAPTTKPKRVILESCNHKADTESIEVAICPRCLRDMRARVSRPTAATYAEGVECDRCSEKILEIERSGGPMESKEAFFHCRRCWYDLCHGCALREMQEVWWGEE